MTRFSFLKVLLISLAIQIAGCAALKETPSETSEIQGPVYYTVKKDDRLGDIAFALTGSTENWIVIAEHNNVEDARKIRVGDVLEIPLALINDSRTEPQSDGGVLAISTVGASNNDESDQLSISKEIPVSERQTAVSTARSENFSTSENDADVVLNPVNINRQFDLSEMEVDVKSDAEATASNAKIRVVGTYFPKGVYEQATESARLLTRVAPGTTFDLDAELDGWYRVRFNGDVAFLRAIDGKIFFPDKPEILRSAEANE